VPHGLAWWALDFPPGGGGVAALGAALMVADRHGFALGGGEEPPGPAQVEWLGLRVQYRGQDAGAAGQPSGFAGGDRGAGGQAGGGEVGGELGLVDGDHDGGGGPAVLGQPAGGDALEQGGEGVRELLGVGHPLTGWYVVLLPG
jgi:hypothetical protein